MRAACEALDIPRAFFLGKGVRGFFSGGNRRCAVRAGGWILRNGTRYGVAFMRRDFRTARLRPFTPRSSTRAGIIARSAQCTGFWQRRARRASAGTSLFIRLTQNPNCWPPDLTNQPWSWDITKLLGRMGRVNVTKHNPTQILNSFVRSRRPA